MQTNVAENISKLGKHYFQTNSFCEGGGGGEGKPQWFPVCLTLWCLQVVDGVGQTGRDRTCGENYQIMSDS